MERRLAAILSADVVGYSRLMGEDEQGTLASLKAHRQDLIDPQIAEHGGRIVKLMGDGALVEFPSVVEAVECAVAIQRGMAERNREIPEGRRIAFRIGVNLGDVLVDGDDILGDGVNVAARLESLAEPGGVCISHTVFDQVKSKLDLDYEDIGEQLLKNIAEPMRVFRIRSGDRAATPVGVAPTGGELPLPEKPSIAILPFANLSGDPEQDYLADGLRLAIQASLVKLENLFLIAPNTANTYRDRDITAEEVGRELGVRCVLEGAVQKSEDRVRITVQLTDTVARQVRWAERFDRDLVDILETQDEITARVVTALDVKLVSGEDARWSRSTLTNLEALDCFYRGLSHFYTRTKEDNVIARSLFESVSRLQPDSPVGPAYVCFTHWLDAFMDWAESRNRSLMQAVEWAEKAIRFKETNGLAHIVLACIHLLNRRHDEALATCRKALELRPNCPAANSYLANILHYCGRSTEAVEKMKAAIRITPVYPPWFLTVLAAAYRDSGEVESSMAVARDCMRLNPNDVDARLVLCSDYDMANLQNDAQRVAKEVLAIDPKFSVTSYAGRQPYKNKEILERLVGTLKHAGLPD